MKHVRKHQVVSAVALFGLVQAALSQQPPNIVQSDARENTAMGTGALQGGGDSYSNTAVGFHALFAGPVGAQCCGGNTAVGAETMVATTSGAANTGLGQAVLNANTTGNYNTATGDSAMLLNTTGSFNTAAGGFALRFNKTGEANTGDGFAALDNNRSGSYNTASGYQALQSNTTADYNAAFGSFALSSNTTGHHNTALGNESLESNVTGSDNTAVGTDVLESNTSGANNVATGAAALFDNTIGNNNTAAGMGALRHNTTGSGNIAIGYYAGLNLTTGKNNIDIGNGGSPGENGVIRIGNASAQTSVYVAGVNSSHVTGAPVYVTSSGQLGVLASSERYKTAIASMQAASAKVYQLRPVSFHLGSDPSGPVQYGLVAEEVDPIYPELVIRDAQGAIQGVRYDELAPLLLNEVQQQQHVIDAQQEQMRGLQKQLSAIGEQNAAMQSALRKLQAGSASAMDR
jgi:uncharacterized coiled-coil protein SlyX